MNFAQTTYETNLPTTAADATNATMVIQIIFGIIGFIAVLYLIFAAIKFITSQGDPAGVAQARQSIIYALLGIVVAVSAEVIVTFVIGSF